MNPAGRKRQMAARALGALALAAALALPQGAVAYSEAARAAYKEGLRAYRAGNLDQARELFRQSEEADPTYPYPAFALSRILHELFELETKHYEEAVDGYERVALLIRATPPPAKERALWQVLYFQGLLYLKGGEYAKALERLEQFLEAYPEFSNPEDVHNALGIALYYLDQYDKAVDQFRLALAKRADYAEARFNLRSVFTRLAIYNEAVVLARAGEMELAQEKIEKLKAFAPRYLPGRRLEARIFHELGQDDQALRVQAEILGLSPNDPLTYGIRVDRARILADRGETEEAARLLRDNLLRFPDIGDERLTREVVELLARVEAAR